MAGAVCFMWAIVGDLFAGFGDSWPLPDPLQAAGPLLFLAGMLVLLALRPANPRTRIFSVVLFALGFSAIGVNLDLLPVASLVVLAALVPLAVDRGRPVETQSTEELAR